MQEARTNGLSNQIWYPDQTTVGLKIDWKDLQFKYIVKFTVYNQSFSGLLNIKSFSLS